MKHAKLLAIPLAMALICSSTIVASAATTNEIAVPAHSNVVETERNPIGNLTMAEREQLANQKCDSCPTPYHFSVIPLTYSYEYGDGWAQQWTDFGFSAKVW